MSATCHGCDAPLPPSRSKPHKWCSQKCRRDTTYVRHCLDCGKRLSSSAGNGPNAPVRCAPCNGRLQGGLGLVWPRERIIERIQAWAARFGEPPSGVSWSPTRADYIGHPELAAAYRAESDDWPSVQTVIYHFGTWNAAMVAAGFTPRFANIAGAPPLTDEVLAHTAALYESGLSQAEVGRRLGMSAQGVRHRLQRKAAA